MPNREQAGAPSVQDDLNQLLGTGLAMAQEQLEDQGAFLPTALVTTVDDEMRMVGIAPADDAEQLDADAMLTDLYALLTQQRDEHRAVVIISDIHLPEEGTDAIHLAAEHVGGTTISVVVPYQSPGPGPELKPRPAAAPEAAAPEYAAPESAGSRFSYGELVGEPGERIVWAGA